MTLLLILAVNPLREAYAADEVPVQLQSGGSPPVALDFAPSLSLLGIVPKTRRARMGRPAEFLHRVRLQVFLERRELAAVRRAARTAGVSLSRFARRAILAAAGQPKEGSDDAR